MRGQSEDRVGIKGSLEWVGSPDPSESTSLQAGVEAFCSHDAGSNGENLLRANERSSTKIGACADRLQDGADCDKASDVRHWEVILAGLDRCNTRRRDSSNEEVDMGRLVGSDKFEVDKELFVESLIEEILLLEASEGVLIEGVLEVFELCTMSFLTSAGEGRTSRYSQSKRTVKW